MCGISGCVDWDLESVENSIRAMNDAMTHRGPDGDGLCLERFGDGWIGLGHRRLSIIDLSSMASQPMWTANGASVIVFNGEIYNFRRLRRELIRNGCKLKSESDTEVLLCGLALEGAEFVRKLEGMYAFAYFDRNKQSLLLARDPIGIKPLYYFCDESRFFFASEVRALLGTGAIEAKFSPEAVASFLAYGSVAEPLSIVQSIEMLEPGSTLELVPGRPLYRVADRKAWWQFPSPAYEGTEQEAVLQTERLLDAAVKDHLVADVPVGVFLSAGVDSTVLASLGYEHSREILAFTVALSHDRDMDEMDIARQTAQRIGVEHIPVVVNEANAEEAAFEWLVNADQPSIDGLNTFIISKAVHAYGIKVAISGLGADELFGGYPSFKEVPRIVQLAKWVRLLPRQMRSLVASAVQFRKPIQAREKLIDMFEAVPSIPKYALHRRRLMCNRQMAGLGFEHIGEDGGSLWLPSKSLNTMPSDRAEPGWAISRVEIDFYQRNTLLRDSDANSMASSLEIRVPFLDHRLVTWVMSLPDSVRFPKGSSSKHLLLQAGRRHLNKTHLQRKKTGFALPMHRWMMGPMACLCRDSLDSLKSSGLVKPSGVDEIWSDFLLDGGRHSSYRALALVALGASLRKRPQAVPQLN